MKIPFTLDAWLADKSQKVETRSGKNVRIICWDKIGVPIVALVGDADDIVTYNRDGTTGQQMQLPSDLFIIIPEPELSEFEDRLRIICENAVEEAHLFPHRTSEDFAKKHSAELLDLARKEIMDGWSKGLRDTQDLSGKAYSEGYILGLDKGKAEALKDLPRWRYKKSGTGLILHDCLVLNKYGCISKSPSGALLSDVWTLEYDELTKLPKLPKED